MLDTSEHIYKNVGLFVVIGGCGNKSLKKKRREKQRVMSVGRYGLGVTARNQNYQECHENKK